MAGNIIAAMPPQQDDESRQAKDLARQQKEAEAKAFAAINAQLEQIQTVVDQMQSVINTQVLPTQGSASAQNYALTTSGQELMRVTFTVPSGYTQAQVLGVGCMSCFNNSGTTADQIWGYVDINGSTPSAQPGWVPPASGGNTTSAFARLMTGLAAGSTFYVRFVGYNRFGNTGAAAGNLNTATLDAQVLFLR